MDEFDKLFDKLKDDQLDLFFDSPGAATISQAASSNVWPYPYIVTNSGTYTLPVGSSGSNVSPGLGLSFNDQWDHSLKQSLSVRGDAEFEGDIKLKGKSLSETLDKIEQRLAILHPNEKLEEKWLELKKLGDAYRALEKDILEKEKIWETLKK